MLHYSNVTNVVQKSATISTCHKVREMLYFTAAYPIKAIYHHFITVAVVDKKFSDSH